MALDEGRAAARQRVIEARHPATSPERLQQLAEDPVRPVRLFTARNPATPAAALQRLADDEELTVRWNALLRADLPASALQTVAEQEAGNVVLLRVVYHHPNAPGSLREALGRGGVCTCDRGFCVPRHWLLAGRWGRPLS